jgi:hypothetical protein
MTPTERHFRVQPIGSNYQPQYSTIDRLWVWEGSTVYPTPREAKAAAYRSAARWLGKPGNIARVLDIPHGD